MTLAFTVQSAAAERSTVRWLRRLAAKAAGAGAAAVAAAAASIAAPPPVALTLRGLTAVAACAAVFWALTWRARHRALTAASWRVATLAGSSSITVFGTRRTTVAVTYDTGTTVAFRLDDLATARTTGAICDSAEVWVASSPSGTVIATPDLRHVAGARPHYLHR